MIFQEKENNKKLILDVYFKYDSNKILLMFNPLYDAGEGAKSPRNDEKTLEFAKEIKKKLEKGCFDLFVLDADEEFYIKCRNTGFEISDPKKFKMAIKEIYSIGMALDIPVYLWSNDDFFYLNEIKTWDYNKEEAERDLTLNQYKALEKFINDHAYGDEYKEFKKREKFSKIF